MGNCGSEKTRKIDEVQGDLPPGEQTPNPAPIDAPSKKIKFGSNLPDADLKEAKPIVERGGRDREPKGNDTESNTDTPLDNTQQASMQKKHSAAKVDPITQAPDLKCAEEEDEHHDYDSDSGNCYGALGNLFLGTKKTNRALQSLEEKEAQRKKVFERALKLGKWDLADTIAVSDEDEKRIEQRQEMARKNAKAHFIESGAFDEARDMCLSESSISAIDDLEERQLEEAHQKVFDRELENLNFRSLEQLCYTPEHDEEISRALEEERVKWVKYHKSRNEIDRVNELALNDAERMNKPPATRDPKLVRKNEQLFWILQGDYGMALKFTESSEVADLDAVFEQIRIEKMEKYIDQGEFAKAKLLSVPSVDEQRLQRMHDDEMKSVELKAMEWEAYYRSIGQHEKAKEMQVGQAA